MLTLPIHSCVTEPKPTAQNRELSLSEYAARADHLTSRPRYVMVELTQGCNLSCPMCRKESIPPTARRMTDRVFDLVAETLFPYAELVDLRGWGESLLLPEFESRLDVAAAGGRKTRVVTNLSYRRPRALKALAQARSFVAVSLDAGNEEDLTAVRPGSRLRLILENLQSLSRLYEESTGTTEGISIHCTVQRPCLEKLWQVARVAAACGVKELSIAGVRVRKGHPFSLDGADSEVDHALSELVQVAGANGVRVVATSRLGSRIAGPTKATFCCRPWLFACVTYDGKIGFCDHNIGPIGEQAQVGDVVSQGFESIWNGTAWREVRTAHRLGSLARTKLTARCMSCTGDRLSDFEGLFVPDALGQQVEITSSTYDDL